MSKTFTFIGDLSSALDYARLRLDDIDDTVSIDETKAPSPFLWDESYLALMNSLGNQRGMATAANIIAAKLAKVESSFSESGGIRVAWKDRFYYERIAKEIMAEPPFILGVTDAADLYAIVKVSHVTRGVEDSYVMRKFRNQSPAYPLGVNEAMKYRSGDPIPTFGGGGGVEICGEETP